MTEGQVAEQEVLDRKLAGTEIEIAGHSRALDRNPRRSGHPFLEWMVVLAKRKSFILKSVCAAALAALLLVLLLPNAYTANTRVLLSGQDQSMPAELLGSQNLPLVSSLYTSDVYVAVLHSEALANRLIDRFSLMGIYGAKLRIGARQTLAGRTEINVGKDGVISISVDDRSPQRAADLANGYVEEFEALTRELAVDPERKREEFLANQVKAAGLQFANAEQALRKTQEKTGLVLFDPQTTGLIEAAAAMRARVAAQEVVVQWMRSFAAQENPALARATQQLAALRDQESKLETGDGGRSGASVTLGQIPGASLEYERKLREVKFREDLFRLLTQQMEAAKLNVTRTDLMVQPSVHLLDRAVAPEEKSSPHRFLIVLSVTALAMLLAVVAASVMEKVERVKWARKPPARVQLYTFHRQEEAEDTRKTG